MAMGLPITTNESEMRPTPVSSWKRKDWN